MALISLLVGIEVGIFVSSCAEFCNRQIRIGGCWMSIKTIKIITEKGFFLLFEILEFNLFSTSF